jgi:hypothetical protein
VDCWNKPENSHKKPGAKLPDNALLATTKSSITCTYCHKTGHTEQQCFKKRNQSPKKDEKVNAMLLVTEHNLLSKELTSHFTPITFIPDSGATDIMVGNNESISCDSKGSYRGLVMQKDFSSFEVILQDVLYIPEIMFNLFSLTKAISTNGVQLSSKGQIITIQIGKIEIIFDTGSGQLLDSELHPIPNHFAATAHPLDINKLPSMFGHPTSQVLTATASKYCFKTKNTLEHTFPNCAICKAKQKQ